jgi:hypothetical protein
MTKQKSESHVARYHWPVVQHEQPPNGGPAGNALAEAQFGKWEETARHGQTKVMLASFPATQY